jgi:HAD superfamily hydrolase (TIGR01509 family)
VSKAGWPDNVAGVIFDCDGTLADTEPLADLAWGEIVSPSYLITDADRAACLGRSFEHVRDHFASVAVVPAATDLWPFFSARMLALIESQLKSFNDAEAALKQLKAEGFLVAIATSSPRRRLDATLRRLGLQDAFDATVAGDEVTSSKPAPDIYLAAARALGLHPDHCIAVEDSPPGVDSARAAGIFVVGVERHPYVTLHRADLVLADLHEFRRRGFGSPCNRNSSHEFNHRHDRSP